MHLWAFRLSALFTVLKEYFYLTAFVTVFNLFVWTHGVFLMEEKLNKKMIIQAVKTPAVIATFLGFALFMLKISLPDILLKTLTYLENLNTPLAMLAAGATIAQTNIFKALKNPRLYYICILKAYSCSCGGMRSIFAFCRWTMLLSVQIYLLQHVLPPQQARFLQSDIKRIPFMRRNCLL